MIPQTLSVEKTYSVITLSNLKKRDQKIAGEVEAWFKRARVPAGETYEDAFVLLRNGIGSKPASAIAALFHRNLGGQFGHITAMATTPKSAELTAFFNATGLASGDYASATEEVFRQFISSFEGRNFNATRMAGANRFLLQRGHLFDNVREIANNPHYGYSLKEHAREQLKPLTPLKVRYG